MALSNPRLDPLTGALRLAVELPTIRFGILRWTPADPPADAHRGPRRVLFLHNLMGSAATASHLAEMLVAEGWSVDALDMPGHGESAWVGRRGEPLADQGSVPADAYELGATALLVRQAIEALDYPSPPSLVGHSWGGAVAVLVAAGGRVVDRTVVIDPPVITQLEGVQLADRLAGDLRGDLDAARAVVQSWGELTDRQDIETRSVALTQTTAGALRAICSATASWTDLEDRGLWRDAAMHAPFYVILGERAIGGQSRSGQAERLRELVGPDRVTVVPATPSTHPGTDLPAFSGALRAALAGM